MKRDRKKQWLEMAIMESRYTFFRVAVPQVSEHSCRDQKVGGSVPCSLCVEVLLDNILNPSFASDSVPSICK